jgi:hypoxanthine phosphoribosyltransferase
MKREEAEIIRSIDWHVVEEMIYKLAERLRDMEISNIYGIPRGGLVVAIRLSHILNKPLITDLKDGDANTLIVDDVLETGATLAPFYDGGFKIAVLYWNSNLEYNICFPDFYVKEKTSKEWIDFPWERRG